MKKGIESFFYIMAGGLGIFLVVALLAYFEENNFSLYYANDGSNNVDILNLADIKTTISQNATYYLDKYVFGSIGTATTSTRIITLNRIDIGKKLAYKSLKTERNFVIKNGLFEKSFKEISFDLTQPLTLKISFKVNQTNRYGRLIIKINGIEIFRNYTYPGQRISFIIDKEHLSTNNLLVITAESSLPRLWAPTAYEITDFKIEALDYTSHEGYVEFELYPEEYEGLSKLEFRFIVTNSNEAGNLQFYMNGKKVYEDIFEPSAEPYSVWFYRKDNLHIGYNVLRLVAESNAEYFLDNNEIRIYYMGNAKTTSYSKNLIIDDDTWQFIRRNKDILQGVVEIKTGSVSFDKGLEVIINGAKYDLAHLEPYSRNYIFFDIDMLKKGENIITFRTKSYVDIDYIKVGIRSK